MGEWLRMFLFVLLCVGVIVACLRAIASGRRRKRVWSPYGRN